MSPPIVPGKELLLDRCIDRMLDGRDWDSLLPRDGPARDEIAPLMRIARRLQVLSDGAPSMTAERLHRVWEKTTRMLRAVLSPKTASPSPVGAIT